MTQSLGVGQGTQLGPKVLAGQTQLFPSHVIGDAQVQLLFSHCLGAGQAVQLTPNVPVGHTQSFWFHKVVGAGQLQVLVLLSHFLGKGHV